MKYTLISGDTKLTFTNFTRATNKLVQFGEGKLYFGRILVGEL